LDGVAALGLGIGAAGSTGVPREEGPIKVLTVTTLYPSAIQPSHGIFVENRIRRLVDTGAVRLQVVAPVPWFPFHNEIFGRYARYAKTPRIENRHDIPIRHPRYVSIPKVGMIAAPLLLGAALLHEIRALKRGGHTFDVIDAHYFYPDGVAAVWVGRRLGLPVVITARGTDLNDYVARFPLVRRMIRGAAEKAEGLITVCQALKDTLVELGIPYSRIRVLRNGVDLELFRPMERSEIRRRLKLLRPTLVSVGHLIPRKGHDVAIRSLSDLPEVELLIVGDGPERHRLGELANKSGVGGRTRFLGQLHHTELATIYNAADALILASSREGWANVLLEAMACGTAVVASNVWGTPEVVTCPAAGMLVKERTPAAFAEAVRRFLTAPPDRAATRAFAENFSWGATTEGQLDIFRAVIARHRGRKASRST